MNDIKKISGWLKFNKASLFVLLVFIFYTLICFNTYLQRTLKGDINNHILSGEMFGVPEDLKERGIKPLYYGPGQTGWDGQFYYYMSNDLLAQKDTASHIDNPPYRYQRIGLSLYAAIVAKATGKDWVSPTTFFISYFLLIAAATFAGARFIQKLGGNPALILLWSLSVGTQITLFNALPDAAADAFLILAISTLYARYFLAASILFAFSALSREVYVLFPSFIFLFYLIQSLYAGVGERNSYSFYINRLLRWNTYYLLLIPGLCAVAWRFFVTSHFNATPSAQATGILGWPLQAWLDYFISGINGNHKLVGEGYGAYFEAISLFLFLIIIVAFVVFLVTSLKKRQLNQSPIFLGLAVSSFALSGLYLSFGPTVIMHYSGYFKALAVFFFLTPIFLVLVRPGRLAQFGFYILLIFALSLTTLFNLKVRILPDHIGLALDQYTNLSQVTETKNIECFGQYDARVKIVGARIIKHGSKNIMVFDVLLKNMSGYDFVSTRNSGSVHMSYHWVGRDGRVVMDGIRSAIPVPLKSGEVLKTSIVSYVPKTSDEVDLKVSPVQEGCAWFYLSNPKIYDSDVNW